MYSWCWGGLAAFFLLDAHVAGTGFFARRTLRVTLLPMAMVALPQLYGLGPGGAVAGGGCAACSAHGAICPCFSAVRVSKSPLVLMTVLGLWASLWIQDTKKYWRLAAAPIPPAGSPNVILIVMDTVSAHHLSLYGYGRPTSAIDGGAGRTRHPI